MRKRFSWLLCALLLLSVSIISWKPSDSNKSTPGAVLPVNSLLERYINNIYTSAHLLESGLDINVFKKAYTGFLNLKMADKLAQNSSIITVVDLSRPSHEKRMWIVDVVNKELLLHTWVAHGQGSGDDIANRFSDNNDSHQSSLGFYLTDNVYFGKHGRSLRLDGLDEGFNSSARARDIVVHAANYVSQQNIDAHGRLGRSFGCPAVSPEVADQVINTIKGKTVLFINGSDDSYTSKYLNEDNLPSNLLGADSLNEDASLPAVSKGATAN